MKINIAFVFLFLASVFNGCAPGSQFQTIGASLLSSTGLVTDSQAEAVFAAGEKLARAASPLSEEEEYYLGRGVSAMILSKYQPLQNPSVNGYVNKVGNTVAAFSGRPETFGGYHFLVLDSDEINAISAPGGFVFISKGLLKSVTTEDELASVLAHEVGHIALGHGVAAISQANLTEALTIIGKEAASSAGGAYTSALTSAFGDSINDIVETLLTKGYSRRQEYAADKYAASLLEVSGYSPKALVAMLKALEKQEDTGGASGWFSTHPSPEDRLDEVEGEVEEKKVAGAQNIETRAKRFKAATKSLG